MLERVKEARSAESAAAIKPEEEDAGSTAPPQREKTESVATADDEMAIRVARMNKKAIEKQEQARKTVAAMRHQGKKQAAQQVAPKRSSRSIQIIELTDQKINQASAPITQVTSMTTSRKQPTSTRRLSTTDAAQASEPTLNIVPTIPPSTGSIDEGGLVPRSRIKRSRHTPGASTSKGNQLPSTKKDFYDPSSLTEMTECLNKIKSLILFDFVEVEVCERPSIVPDVVLVDPT
ncbi:hypothetical protein BUALT_Bualt01G0134500 [Buddleja alternifolia]|uniref:Uncharacterized protein n=1 Tax=Buddleja alternifolia TaxID=168488 RepID=A0AAV6YCR3_9LAMI|nr:hypothetical protein BUALT_Bualt01G0134500 [Buddleja alternifolia]